MTTLLNIQSSQRYDTSVSRLLSDQFIEQWQKENPQGQVITRDLMHTELPFISIEWINGAFIPDDQRTPEMIDALKISDDLVAEFSAADQIFIGAPMHNFNVTANFKAYIDQIVRFNKTYNLEGGMLKDRPVTVILSSGRNYTPGSPDEHYNYVSGFLKCILGHMGIKNIQILLAGGTRAVFRGLETFEDHLLKYQPEVLAATQHHKQL